MNIYFRHSSPFGKGDTAPPISQKCSQKHKKIPKNKIWGKFFILGKNHKIAVVLDFTGFAGSCRFSQKRHIENILCSGAHHIILKGQNPVSSLSSHPTAKPHCKTTLQNPLALQRNSTAHSAVVILTPQLLSRPI